jgi:glycosyltransferase involved in cell wall biosynthesis
MIDKYIDNETDYRVSVLMSVYAKENHNYFREALDSMLVKQTLKPDEFVLIVDGPVGSEIDLVIDEYEKLFPNILKVYRLKQNQGLGNALNIGMTKCSHQFVARADSDDINVPERLEIQINEFKRDNTIDIIGGNIDEFEKNYINPINKKIMPQSHREIVKMAKMRNPLNHMSVMFKKDVILTIGNYEDLPYLEDYLWVRALKYGAKLKNINKILVHARIGNGMLVRRSNRQYILSWKKLNYFMKENKQINIFEYLRNIILVKIFIYTPVIIKKYIYKYILR